MGLLSSIAVFGLMLVAAAGVLVLLLRAMPARTYVIPSKIPPEVMEKILRGPPKHS